MKEIIISILLFLSGLSASVVKKETTKAPRTHRNTEKSGYCNNTNERNHNKYLIDSEWPKCLSGKKGNHSVVKKRSEAA
jgi:hypothetical protein